MTTIRASSLPLIMRCPAAAVSPALVVREHCDAADIGTAAHLELARLVDTGRVEWTGITDPEVRGLMAAALRMWPALEPLIGGGDTEYSLAHLNVTGTADVVAASDDGSAVVLDWKTGRADTDYREQLRGYACLCMLQHPAIRRVTTVIAWLRDETIERREWMSSDVAPWLADVSYTLTHPEHYVVGTQCHHCPRAHECPGARVHSQAAVSAITTTDGVDLSTATPDQLAELLTQARHVSSLADRVISTVRGLVAQAGGSLETTSGRLILQEVQRRGLATVAALPVLAERLSAEELAECMTLSLSDAEQAVSVRAPKRGAAAARRELADALETAGAMRTKTTNSLVFRRKAT